MNAKRIKINVVLFNRIIHFICFLKGITLGKNITFNGFPQIHRKQNSKIIFGDNCRFNSSKNSVVLGIHQSCSFVTMRQDSEIRFGNNSGATGLKIAARNKILIGNNVLIGANCIIIDNDFHHSNAKMRKPGFDNLPAKPVIIEDNVFIGFNSVILKGVTIGENSVIGASSVVFNNIPANSIAVGNPCKVIMRKKIT